MVPVVDPDPLAVSALPTPDSWEWFSEAGKSRAHIALILFSMLGLLSRPLVLPARANNKRSTET